MQRPPVLFLPGTLCTPAVFEHQVNELSAFVPNIETVRFTNQQSITAMAELAIGHIPSNQSAAIIGFSMGGMVAMEIYRQAPGRVAKLALLNSNCHADLPEREADREMQMEQIRQMGLEQVIRQYHLPNCLYRSNRSAEELIVSMAMELGTECYSAQHQALATRSDSTATLGKISCPTLILGGAQDRLCDANTQSLIHHSIENSQLRLVDDCGHFSMLEQPRQVSAALRGWYLSP